MPEAAEALHIGLVDELTDIDDVAVRARAWLEDLLKLPTMPMRETRRIARAAVIDCLQYCNYSEEIFRDLRAGGVDAIHTTISYHEDFRETVDNIVRWNRWFETCPDLIFAGRTAGDVRRAQAEGRTAVFFGLQNCSPMEDDIGLVEVLHTLRQVVCVKGTAVSVVPTSGPLIAVDKICDHNDWVVRSYSSTSLL